MEYWKQVGFTTPPFINGVIYLVEARSPESLFIKDKRTGDAKYFPIKGGVWQFEPSTEAEYLAQEGKSKESEFVVGKCYRFFANDTENLALINRAEDDYIGADHYVSHNTYSGSGAWNPKRITNIREVPLEEIQQYLPEGHVDKLPVKEETWIPKVGEWVVITNGSYRNSRPYQIHEKSFLFSNEYILDIPNILKPTVSFHYLRKATPEEIASVTDPDIKKKLDSIGNEYKSPVITSKEYSEKSIEWLGEMMQESILHPEPREMDQYVYNMINVLPVSEDNEQPILISKVKTSNKIIVL